MVLLEMVLFLGRWFYYFGDGFIPWETVLFLERWFYSLVDVYILFLGRWLNSMGDVYVP